MSTETDVLHTALKDFKRSVEITRDVRFQANLRLAARQRNSSYLISLLSLFVIALSLLPNIIALQSYQSQILLACSVVLSAFIIFTSLIDGSQNFYHQGELLHQCARKVATVHHELKNIDPENDYDNAKKRLTELQEQYRQALDECPINHENVDFIKEQSYKPHHFPNNFAKNHWIKLGQIQFKKLQAFIMAHLWMGLHLIALIGVCLIVYRFVLLGSSPVPTLPCPPAP
ncbi:SLATT domain-containing protein [Leptolyngbya sp. 7M]|uniref:SLATT domain-containing protein n=1 Tax=Leptolyngbya sp. 7M TaxID=2812896 RepID=UPI001B8B0168|nr:SLATT domain-containing protein [Leptolyngbya sp. 7M]QYO64788.1 SLATT domain-containing protein [Leptolyngbya sp. 7M]QYU66152.1 SLATT domain-containing protein [Leptolyngbya sp. 15MV]